MTPRAAQPPPQAASWYTPAPGPTGTVSLLRDVAFRPGDPEFNRKLVEARSGLIKLDKYRQALEWISGYWLGPTAVCQVHVDHMKGIARRALGEPYA